MIEKIITTLFLDEQQEIPAGYCGRCGGALYGPSLRCIRCEEDSYDT